MTDNEAVEPLKIVQNNFNLDKTQIKPMIQCMITPKKQHAGRQSSPEFPL